MPIVWKNRHGRFSWGKEYVAFLRLICGSTIHDAGIPVSFHMLYIFSVTNLKRIRGSLQPACKDWTTRTDRLKQNELVVFSRI